MDKVVLPKEVADDLDFLKGNGFSNQEILKKIYKGSAPLSFINYIHDETFENFLNALVNGYKAKKTKEEELKDYYDDFRRSRSGSIHDAKADVIKLTLDTLGIEIEGINK